MLASLSNLADQVPEDVELDFSFRSAADADTYESLWFGHPLRLRGVLRDGTQVSLGLNMTECAQVFIALQDDAALQGWAEMMQAVRSGATRS